MDRGWVNPSAVCWFTVPRLPPPTRSRVRCATHAPTPHCVLKCGWRPAAGQPCSPVHASLPPASPAHASRPPASHGSPCPAHPGLPVHRNGEGLAWPCATWCQLSLASVQAHVCRPAMGGSRHAFCRSAANALSVPPLPPPLCPLAAHSCAGVHAPWGAQAGRPRHIGATSAAR